MQSIPFFFAYLGPETTVPLASFITTIVAFVLMFGKSAFRLVVGWLLRLRRLRRHGWALSGPHFGRGRRQRRINSDARLSDEVPTKILS